MADLYRERAFKAFWIAGGQPTQRARILRGFLDGSTDEGLRPQDYRVDEIRRLWRKADVASQAKLDLLLTLAFIRYALDVSRGRSAARRLENPAATDAAAAHFELPPAIQHGLETADVERFLRLQAPQHPYYQLLKRALRQYRNIARTGGWPSIPHGTLLQAGMADSRIPLLRQHLALTEDGVEANRSSAIFDQTLETAVRHFQRRHALPEDGVIGGETLAVLNVPVEQRIRQIIVNLERWRWLPVDVSGRHIWVNIPSFNLLGLQDGNVELAMPVVVGKIDQPTPAFDERMEYLEFNPDWRVPQEIAVNEYLPELQKDPARLMRKHIRFFQGAGKEAPEVDPRAIDWNLVTAAKMDRYVLRQDPGPWNALGAVKFMFPNKYNVYLHDTSAPGFFARPRRTYSHGCVRVSRPYELAAWVLAREPSPWNLERIQATIASGQHLNVSLDKPLPVHLIYRTALIGEDNSLHFPPDVYNRDGLLEKALFDSKS